MNRKVVKVGLVLVLLIMISLGVLYYLDMDRMKNNKPILFSTWGKNYKPPLDKEYLEPENDKKLLKFVDWSYVSKKGITDEMAYLEDTTEEVFNLIGNNLQSLLDDIAEKEREDPSFIIEGK